MRFLRPCGSKRAELERDSPKLIQVRLLNGLQRKKKNEAGASKEKEKNERQPGK